ncbi:chromate efflux transporter [Paenibacillus woosongensis]|uniref:Chromate efflux transporter n=1 Tax=Paenibacillus woosongensis TaxID=307580 RepID=A0AA95IB39_9BACL|nr:chromate efflux transporter [Paenibacillus woosongensis]WHX51238.1 chromate efflux transporter [Paenibacillus woosongensis]
MNTKNTVKKETAAQSLPRITVLDIFLASAKLGLTSFGGPVAHLGYFHQEYVVRRKWMEEKAYADLVALCQFLPGPASSQVGIGVGLRCAGLMGAIAAWVGFTLPSILLLGLFAIIVQRMNVGEAPWLHGLKLTAVAIVAQAVWSMGTKLATTRKQAGVAVGAAAVVLLWPGTYSQVGVIAAAALLGLIMYRHEAAAESVKPAAAASSRDAHSCRQSFIYLGFYFALLLLLPLFSQWSNGGWLSLVDGFYRAGSLVFGGGHVVLPLLQEEVVAHGWVSQSDFIAGYGAAQAVPGPLFTFASYLGAIFGGVPGLALATIAIFLPAFLLVAGVLPLWDRLSRSITMQRALQGIHAAVVGILLAALYDPIWTGAVRGTADFVIVLCLFAMLVFWKLPPWSAVIAGAAAGMLAQLFV